MKKEFPIPCYVINLKSRTDRKEKLKLSLQNIEGAAVLTRQQLKMVMGGDGDGGSGVSLCKGIATCLTNDDCKIDDPSCVCKGASEGNPGVCR